MKYFCAMNTFSRILTDWYETNKRDLPWRDISDPYKIWVSEIILQQTRVGQGYGYYTHFVRRFPDVQALAQATEDEVMRYWQGLGYYTRARNMHQAAQSMNGKFPQTYQEVRALKGVGDYTAAAICASAFNMPYAAVDGNVYRVLARHFGIDKPIDSAEGKKLFTALAQELLDKRQPGTFNQAMMDFGATVCTPHRPHCEKCPLADTCEAVRQGLTDKLPVKRHQTKSTDRYFTYLYVMCGDRICIRKRTQNDIWKGLYELPLIESAHRLNENELTERPEFKLWLADGSLPRPQPLEMGVRHVLSHQIIHADFYALFLSEDTTSFHPFLRAERADLTRFAFPRLIQAFLERH